MKPASIIALIIAVMLIVLGFSTCLIAKNMASANGEMLFSEKQAEGFVNRFSFKEGEEVAKLSMKVNDASIYIYGQSGLSEPYVEIVNFRDSYYTATHANQVFSFDEVPDVLSMFKFWENGFSFRGMRYIVNFNNRKPEGEKIIRIYLTPTTGALKIIDIEGDNCKVYLDTLMEGGDFKINLTHGAIHADSIKVGSMFQITGEELEIDITASRLSKWNIQCPTLQLKADNIFASQANIQFTDGMADITTTQTVSSLNCTLNSQYGTIYINGNALGDSFSQSASNGALWTVQTENGTIAMQNATSPITGSSYDKSSSESKETE